MGRKNRSERIWNSFRTAIVDLTNLLWQNTSFETYAAKPDTVFPRAPFVMQQNKH